LAARHDTTLNVREPERDVRIVLDPGPVALDAN
jgi:hypothetical protein